MKKCTSAASHPQLLVHSFRSIAARPPPRTMRNKNFSTSAPTRHDQVRVSQMRGVRMPTSSPPLCLPAPAKPRPKHQKKTNNPPPTSPHEFHQVAVADLVAEVADIDAVLPLADLCKLHGLLVVGVHRAAKGAGEGVGGLAAAVVAVAAAAAGAGARGSGAGARTRAARAPAGGGGAAPGARTGAGALASLPSVSW